MADSPAAIWVDVTPTAGGTVNVPFGDPRVDINLCINNSALLTSLTLYWPVAGVGDGQAILINCASAVTLVSHTAGPGGSMRGGTSAFVGGSNGIYKFRLSNKTWYKFT